MARRIAAAATADGLLEPGLLKLQSLGCNGVHEGNVERDFHRSFNAAAALSLQPQLVSLPMLEKWRKLRGRRRICDASGSALADVWVLAPTDIVCALCRLSLSFCTVGFCVRLCAWCVRALAC